MKYIIDQEREQILLLPDCIDDLIGQDNTVTCPVGKILSKLKMRGKNTIYSSKEVCRQCPNKCTDSKNIKQ